MKVFILMYMVSVCLALPNNMLFDYIDTETFIPAEIIYDTKIVKRHQNALQAEFDLTDANHDGHITADELATFFFVHLPDHQMTKEQWLRLIRDVLPKIDSNNNNTLEIHEYAVLARYGGYSD